MAGHFFLPAIETNALKFVAISDTHCRHRSLKLPKGDVILHAGDICYRSSREEVMDFLDWFGRLPYMHKVFIAGNHDFFFEKTKPSLIKTLLPNNVHYLKDDSICFNGIKIWGSPYTPLFYRWAFNKKRGEPLARHWKNIPENTDILLTHGPVYGILDAVVNDQQVGDRDLLNRVMAVKPKVHVCGHIHESYGIARRHSVKFINASVLNEAYELVNKPIVFDLAQNSVAVLPPT